MTIARLAGFTTRALALAIDGAIINGAAVVVGAGVALAASVVGLDLRPGDPAVIGSSAAGWILLVSTYLVAFWSLTGQTPGMRFMGIRVLDRNGAPPGRWQSIRRLIGLALAALPAGAGFLLILVDDRRRGLQDYIASTLVIHDAPRRHRPNWTTGRPLQDGSLATELGSGMPARSSGTPMEAGATSSMRAAQTPM